MRSIVVNIVRMFEWRRVGNVLPCKNLSPLKDNGQNSGRVRQAGMDYTMDEVAAFNEECA